MRIGKIQIDSPNWGYGWRWNYSLNEGYIAMRFRYLWVRVSWKTITEEK